MWAIAVLGDGMDSLLESGKTGHNKSCFMLEFRTKWTKPSPCWFVDVMPCCQGLTLYTKVCYLIEIIELQGFLSLSLSLSLHIHQSDYKRLTLNWHYNKRCPCTPNDFTGFFLSEFTDLNEQDLVDFE